MEIGITSDQRIKAIEEGQEFFEKYILSENTTQNIPSAPLTKGLEKIIENSKSASQKETAFFNLLDEVTSGLPDEETSGLLDEETLNLEENHAEKVRIYANNVLSLKYELTDSDWDELCLVTLCAANFTSYFCNYRCHNYYHWKGYAKSNYKCSHPSFEKIRLKTNIDQGHNSRH
jgi:hypothetical protein